MIVAYELSADDDGTHMLGEDTYRPPRSAGFHDWRFGKDGIAHPATCPTCGRKTDPEYVNPQFKAKRRTWDISATCDGYDLVSKRFRAFCRKHGWRGMSFVPLPVDNDFFVHLQPSSQPREHAWFVSEGVAAAAAFVFERLELPQQIAPGKSVELTEARRQRQAGDEQFWNCGQTRVGKLQADPKEVGGKPGQGCHNLGFACSIE